MIVDASVLLSAFFPDENQPQAQALLWQHVAGEIHLRAPDLLPYELSNALRQAERRGRISEFQSEKILKSMKGLEIEILPIEFGAMLPLARRFDRSAYDAAYLFLSEFVDEPLITGDLRLYNTVRHKLDNVLWIGEFQV